MAARNLGPWSGVYRPGYQLHGYRNGDPSRPTVGVDLRSVTSLQTSKSLDDISGTFTITLKDSRARERITPMDVMKIRLRGHNQGWDDVLWGVVDYVGPNDRADNQGAQQDTLISGRCTAKYLQSNSLFLPVWDPKANLPTALIFGAGDASHKLGTTVGAHTPREIFGYVFDRFVVGQRNKVGISGTPNARFWMNRVNRFEWVRDAGGQTFQIPFIQFDEDTVDVALKRLEVQGFTEAWVDEVGNIVYRPPQWDAPVSWNLHTGGLISDSLQDSDVAATYVEVVPAGNPGLPSAQAQAIMAGRAPIPSDYVTGLQKSGFRSPASPEFIIDTDSQGNVTANGLKNYYYRLQRKYGVRPYQVTSPLLASREQAQAQAQGLLRFMLRLTKSGSVTIPGEPGIRLGTSIHLYGSLRGTRISRTYYVQGVSHEYVEGDHYTTTLELTHGRDPDDPSWQRMVLPNFTSAQLAADGGISYGSGPGQGSIQGYVNPVPGWQPSRIDAGVDGTLSGPYLAPGKSKIVVADSSNAGWKNGGIIAGQLLDGPLAGLVWYVAEGVVPSVGVGDVVKAGDPVANLVASPYNSVVGNIETGWANPSAPAQPLGFVGNTDDQAPIALAYGDSFNRLIKQLGGQGGSRSGRGVGVQAAQIPSRYP